MRNVILVCLVLLSTLIVLPSIHTIANSKTITADQGKVIYPLPYPGILADHPLYVLKEFRDNILLFTTRDSIKKSQLYLNISDKHLAISLKLMEKGKEELAVRELSKSEETATKIPVLLKESKEQGVAPSNDFIMKLYQSNAKHQELITEMMKKITQANIETLTKIIKMNEQTRKEIGKI